MSLRRIDKHSTYDNELYESVVGTQRRLVKVYRGPGAQARRDREIAALRVWREAGFGVPEVFEQTVDGIQPPYAVLELLQGRSLRDALADAALSSARSWRCAVGRWMRCGADMTSPWSAEMRTLPTAMPIPAT